MSFFILSRTSQVLSVKFCSSVVRICGLLPTAYRAVVFSTAVPPGVQALTRAVLGGPRRIGVTVSHPPRAVVRATCIYCSVRGLHVLRSLFSGDHPRHIVVFSSSGVGMGRLTSALGQVGFGITTVRSSLRRSRHRRIVGRFGGKHVSVLITASIISHNVSVGSVGLIVGFSVPRSPRSCIRHVNHATHKAGNRKLTVAFVSARRRFRFGHVRRFLSGRVCGVPISPGFNRAPLCRPRGCSGVHHNEKHPHGSNKGKGDSGHSNDNGGRHHEKEPEGRT